MLFNIQAQLKSLCLTLKVAKEYVNPPIKVIGCVPLR